MTAKRWYPQKTQVRATDDDLALSVMQLSHTLKIDFYKMSSSFPVPPSQPTQETEGSEIPRRLELNEQPCEMSENGYASLGRGDDRKGQMEDNEIGPAPRAPPHPWGSNDDSYEANEHNLHHGYHEPGHRLVDCGRERSKTILHTS